jgi:hypothetical protein
MPTFFTICDRKQNVRILHTVEEVIAEMNSFQESFHFWDPITNLNVPGGLVRWEEYGSGGEPLGPVVSIHRHEI